MLKKPLFFLILAMAGLCSCADPDINIGETPITILSDTPGRGRSAEDGRIVYIDYDIKLPNGKTVIKHKDWRFVLGNHSVVAGIEDAVLGMKVGGRRQVECPPHKHWGRNGYADVIPPNTWLIVDIKLNRVD